MTNYTATPTEFDGCRFRSKSEAMFAAAISSVRGPHLQDWIYEPEFLRHGEWIPDFAIPWTSHSHRSFSFMVIEYKPSRVTKTYLEQLEQRFLGLSKFPIPLDCWLVCYDWFERSADMVWHLHKGEIVQAGHLNETLFGPEWFNAALISEVKSKRFDLEQRPVLKV